METAASTERDRMDGSVTRTDRDGWIYVRENMKNRNICKTARKRWGCAERASEREARERRRETEDECIPAIERVEGRQRVCERR